jgi:3-oxoadipate enol-lactonase
MPKVKINDIDLYYEIDGEGDWLIFVHGGGCTHLDWARQVYAMRDRYKCLTYDSRGCGQSGGMEDAPTGDRDLLALMDTLGIQKAYLNGWSAGGYAVSTIAQQHPERVLGLIMTDTPFGFYTAALNKWAGLMLDKFDKGFAVLPHSFSPTLAARDPQTHFLLSATLRLNETRRPPSVEDYKKRYGDAYRKMRDTKPVDYSKFPVPTLFIIGSEDELTLPSLVHDTAAAVGGSRLVQIPGSGHSVQWEKTGVYNAIVMAFVDKISQRNHAGEASKQ